MHHIYADYANGENARRELQKNPTRYIDQIQEATSCKTATDLPSLKPSK